MSLQHFLSDHSIEITRKDVGALADAADILSAGTGISITFLPGDDIGQLISTASQVRRLGFEPVPHISARRIRSSSELQSFISRLAGEAGVQRVFVIAGDPPKPLGPFADAHAVLKSGLLEENGIRTVGVAGYPEKHPFIDSERIEKALREKAAFAQRAGLNLEIVTQFVFDPDTIVRWVRTVRELGIYAPIRIGIAGPASVQTLLRFAARCGVGASAKVMAKYGVSITRLLTTATPDPLVTKVAEQIATDGGTVKVHLYPFGGVRRTAEWAVQRMSRAV